MNYTNLAYYTESMVVPKQEVIRFISDCLQMIGLSEENAHCVGHHLFFADYRGIFSHGLLRLEQYMNDIQNGVVDGAAVPKVIHDFKAIALVDGCNSCGQVVGKYCMRLAIEKAHRFGIGFVSARGSNHFGICGYYAKMAMERGMIGFCCSNSSPMVVPTNSLIGAIGNNPLSLGMATTSMDHFLIDIGTAATSVGQLQMLSKEGKTIPKGWVINEQGEDVTDPQEALKSQMLLPLGGYKGYGLTLMIELFCGILSGSDVGPDIRQWTKSNKKIANLGQAFIAIYPDVFAPGARTRLAHLLTHLRDLPFVGEEPVIVPGDVERMESEKVDREGGIHYHFKIMEDYFKLAEKIGVEPMKFNRKKLVTIS